MRWTYTDLHAQPVDVYDVLREELLKEWRAAAAARPPRR
jgi:hypothetical protein